jgi:dihydrolipoamide dehydrogenase
VPVRAELGVRIARDTDDATTRRFNTPTVVGSPMADSDHTTETNVLVVGGGPGGYVSAIRAAQLGLDVTLVEKDAYGGTCLNRGCIPSKALISALDLTHRVREGDHMGIDAEVSIDMGTMTDWKDDVVDRLTGGVEQLCRGSGVTLMEGRAAFTGAHTARVESDGDETSMTFEHAILATGSRPIEIPGFEFDGDRILSSKHALALDEMPASIVVVGAGYIGLELATVFAKAGSDVTVVEMLDRALPQYERDLTQVVQDRATDLGIEFAFGEVASDWSATDDGLTLVTENEDGATAEYDAEKCLIAVGREPVTDTVDPAAAGVERDDDGFFVTDDRARTTVDHVYAVGDAAGEPMLAHKGMMEGEVAAEVIAGEPAALDRQAVPKVVFTDPEIATVGMTEDEAETVGFDPAVGEVRMGTNGRALTRGDDTGFVRVVADTENGFLLGAAIVAPEASELIGELALAVEMGATVTDVVSTVHAHPTLAEAVREAAAKVTGRAIHAMNR